MVWRAWIVSFYVVLLSLSASAMPNSDTNPSAFLDTAYVEVSRNGVIEGDVSNFPHNVSVKPIFSTNPIRQFGQVVDDGKPCFVGIASRSPYMLRYHQPAEHPASPEQAGFEVFVTQWNLSNLQPDTSTWYPNSIAHDRRANDTMTGPVLGPVEEHELQNDYLWDLRIGDEGVDFYFQGVTKLQSTTWLGPVIVEIVYDSAFSSSGEPISVAHDTYLFWRPTPDEGEQAMLFHVMCAENAETWCYLHADAFGVIKPELGQLVEYVCSRIPWPY